MHFTDFPQTIVAWTFYLIVYVPVLLIIWCILLYIAKRLLNFKSRKKSLFLLLLIVFSPTIWMIPRVIILGSYYCFQKPKVEFPNIVYGVENRVTIDELKIIKSKAVFIPIKNYPNVILFIYDGRYYVYVENVKWMNIENIITHFKKIFFDSSQDSYFNFIDQRMANYYEYELSKKEANEIQTNYLNFAKILKSRERKYAFSLAGRYYIPASWTGDMFSNYFLEPKTLFKTMHAVSCENDPDIHQLLNLLLKPNQSK